MTLQDLKELLVRVAQKVGPVIVSDWRQAWRWFSIQAMILAGALLTTWSLIPADLKQLVPPLWGTRIVVAILVLGVVGRLLDQPKDASSK
jgi:hypothetical protein